MELLHCSAGSRADLARLLSTPAPILEDVSVRVLPLVTLSSPLFADNAPRLRKLEIGHVRGFSWTSSFLRNLVCFHAYYGEVGAPSSVTDFVSTLRQFSQVEDLELYSCLTPFSSAPQPSDASQIAQLPSLRRLAIEGRHASECVGFLRHVQIPSTTTLCVESYTHRNMAEFDALCPFLAPAHGEFRYVHVLFNYNDFQVKAYHDTWCHQPARQLFVNHRLGWYKILSFMRALFRDAGMLRHCLALDLEILVRMTPAMWLDTFGGAVEVQQMNVKWGEGLCVALSAAGEDLDVTGTGVVWPKLRRLQLHRVDFRDGSAGGGEHGAGHVLLRALEHRRRCGAGLVDLELDDCHETEEWLRTAESLVERVSVSVRDEPEESRHSSDEDEDSEQESSEDGSGYGS
ncbi:hypothetical protein FA95DRAFT_883498 [Auriscalpium vulgare]|uniref:Uncharacterized protein n=1 Tax=Auriscalpium vulgare TaxID=40419 RepID=A0ACB8R950_9AGAM|nr:hypothetical protein FA95DRAFT_883498 [Auriscalpium vulgare]